MPKGPREMPIWRDMLLLSVHNELAEGFKNMDDEFALAAVEANSYPSSQVEMYYGTAEYNDLLQEMLTTFDEEDIQTILRQIVQEKGARGAVAIGFESFKLPVFMLPARIEPKATAQDPDVIHRQHDYTFEREDFIWPCAIEALWLSWCDTGTTVEAFISVKINHTNPFFESFGIYGGKTQGMATTHLSPLGRSAAVALWTMLTPSLVATSQVQPLGGLPPKVKKQLDPKRKNRESLVTVVNLRRQVRHDMAQVRQAEHVEWQHSWIVRGHWRKQPYGPQKTLRRMVYITPYVKGPVDKPLKHKEKVFKF